MASNLNLSESRNYLVPKTNSFYDDYVETNEKLGVGLNGSILVCIDKKTKIKYALKKLDDSVKARREIDLHWRASRGCRYIVQIKDVYNNTIISNGEEKNTIFLITELMSGGELFYKIIKKINVGQFTERDVAKMMFEIGSAVQHLHTFSIAHRDLKPENLLLSSNDDDAIIKICDFGFAKELINNGLTSPCYTPYYVAPEVLNCESKAIGYDLSCDIWSMGVIMYILLCGKPPFAPSPNARAQITDGMKERIKKGNFNLTNNAWNRVSDEAKGLIKQMLDINPQSRINIDQIMRNNWIQKYVDVPLTPLANSLVDALSED